MERSDSALAAARRRAAEIQASSSRAPGTSPCACCAQLTLDTDLYLGQNGAICHVCHAEEESDDTLSRGARDQALSNLFLPGFVALALMIFEVPARFMFGPNAALALAFIPILGMLVSLTMLIRAFRVAHLTQGDRIRLAGSGVFSAVILLALGLLMAGVSIS